MASLTIPALSKEALLSGEISRTVLTLPEDGCARRDALFDSIAQQYPELRMEQNAAGEVILMAPEGNESSYRHNKIATQLEIWAELDGRGVCFGSNTVFRLPDGSKLGPDAAWVSVAKLKMAAPEERRGFLKLAPEFVIELKSPTDSWHYLQRKMGDWRRNGVELGWLIDADKRQALIYTQGEAEPTALSNPRWIEGSLSVAGFRLEMKDVWRGLDF